MFESVRTERLIAERLRAADFADLDRMHRDPRVMATLGGTRTDEQTRTFLQDHLEHWDRLGFGLWVIRDLADGRFVGRAGLRPVHVGGQDEIELAYALMSEYWGRGIATEIAEAALMVAFRDLVLAEVVCFTTPTNAASRRVMEKVGFRFEREVVHAGLPHVLFRQILSEWNTAQPRLGRTP